MPWMRRDDRGVAVWPWAADLLRVPSAGLRDGGHPLRQRARGHRPRAGASLGRPLSTSRTIGAMRVPAQRPRRVRRSRFESSDGGFGMGNGHSRHPA